ncbi:uncharacterized protein PG986_010866 [Apiospora aurea]|uniref:GDP/GTP exchange factor Sec2 N-terminal domain-containing protein n=1 Tax=Apiospora aurea TaxID=335848 RepID=A0ABR1Q3G3_9PEZI
MGKFSFIHMASWTGHQASSGPNTPPRGFGHFRSLSTFSGVSPRSQSPAHVRSPSSSQLSSMASSGDLQQPTLEVHTPPPKRMPSKQSLMEDQEFSTHLGPRSRATSRVDGSTPDPTAHHPDLDDEVATLSTKLVNALNHQTNLDDTLSSTRQELEDSKDRIQLLSKIVEEKRVRGEMEKEKKKIEQELENLTQALFEEANKMVISAKEDAQKEQDALQRKNDQLKAQLADSESLLKSSQEQLVQLKLVLEQMTAERDDHSGTTPSSPGFSKFAPTDEDGNTSEGISQSGITEPLSPTYPTNLTHLLQPVVRMDLSSFEDFMALVNVSKRAPPSRASSGSYSGLSLGLLNATSSSSAASISNVSTTSLSAAGTSIHSTSPQTPNTPSSAISAGSSGPLPPLKDSKFYKRVLAEDIEPTLRLDTAPGLSWLARRAVLSAMCEGTLVVEPVPSNSPFASISKPQFYPCSLCGDTRRDEPHLRNHRFRTSEAESAQRYPLCKYCLGRVRSTCDFLGFLRIVKDGFWRADDADSERAAWEESVRLREQMFWSRIGGGVVPVSHSFHGHTESSGKSPRMSISQEDQPEAVHQAAESENDGGGKAQALARDASEVTLTPQPIITKSTEASGSVGPVAKPEPPVTPTHIPAEFLSADDVTSSPVDIRISSQPLETPIKLDDGVKRLSLSIPGAFEE